MGGGEILFSIVALVLSAAGVIYALWYVRVLYVFRYLWKIEPLKVLAVAVLLAAGVTVAVYMGHYFTRRGIILYYILYLTGVGCFMVVIGIARALAGKYAYLGATLLEEKGNVDGAKAAYWQAIGSRNPDWTPRAAYFLGVLLKKQGDVDGARTAYHQAIDNPACRHRDWTRYAALNLGILLAERGDVDGAKAAWQQVIDSRHPDAAPKAALNLGILLKKQGDVDGAKAAYQQAIDSGHPETASDGVTESPIE